MKAYRVYDYYISFLPIVSLYNKYKSSLLTSFPTLTKNRDDVQTTSKGQPSLSEQSGSRKGGQILRMQNSCLLHGVQIANKKSVHYLDCTLSRVRSHTRKSDLIDNM